MVTGVAAITATAMATNLDGQLLGGSMGVWSRGVGGRGYGKDKRFKLICFGVIKYVVVNSDLLYRLCVRACRSWKLEMSVECAWLASGT